MSRNLCACPYVSIGAFIPSSGSFAMSGPQDVSTQTDSSVYDFPPRPERVINQYHTHTLESLARQVTESGLSVITPEAAYAEIMDRIQDSLRQRTALDSYQTRSWFLKFLQEPMLAKMFRKFTKAVPRERAGSTKATWTCTSPETLGRAVELSGTGKFAMGTAKGFKSGLFIHVVAVLMTLRVDYAVVRSVKSQRAYFSYMYALVDEDGELTLPQDKQRRELALDEENRARLRSVALQNVTRMAQKGFPVSPRWLEQMGDEFAAKAAQARRYQSAYLAQRPRPVSVGDSSERQSHDEDEDNDIAPPVMQ
eukprot:6214787-Pleurochrysis_carterae.AAC.2